MSRDVDAVFTGARKSAPAGLPAALEEINEVTAATALTCNGNQSTLIANLAYSNSVQVQDGSAKNALTNQQALSQLAIAVLGKSTNAVQNLGAAQTRSAVEVLTGNEVASQEVSLGATLAAFAGKGPSGRPGTEVNSLKFLLGVLRTLADDLKQIFARNEALKGDGTREHPYETDELLYVEPPLWLGFVNVAPEELNLAVDKDRLAAR